MLIGRIARRARTGTQTAKTSLSIKTVAVRTSRCALVGWRRQRPVRSLPARARYRHARCRSHHDRNALHDHRATSSPTGAVPSVVAIVHRSTADCRWRATCVRGPLPRRRSIERSGDVPHTAFGVPLMQSARAARESLHGSEGPRARCCKRSRVRNCQEGQEPCPSERITYCMPEFAGKAQG